MAAVIAYGGEGAGDFATAVCVMHEYVFGRIIASFRDLSWIIPLFIFDFDLYTLLYELPDLLKAFLFDLYEHLTAFQLYKASQV